MEVGENIVFKQCQYINTGKIIATTEDGYLVEIPTGQSLLITNEQVLGKG